MEVSQTRDALRELGWGKTRASCYCALVQYGEMKASEISKHTGLRQEKVYNPLSRLENEGYVVLTDFDPKHYRAQNPRYVIEQERAKFEEETDEILEGLEEAWARSEDGIPSTGDHAHVLSGKGGMRTGRSEIIEGATDSLYVFDNQFALTAPNDVEEIESLLENDADVEIIARDSEKLAHLASLGAKTRFSKNTTRPSMYVADKSEVMLNVSNSRATVLFEDEYFAGIIISEFEELFKSAQMPDYE